MKWIHFDHNGSHFFETKSRNWPFLPKLFNMAQWINIGKYFFKWLSDLFSYCGGSCVCGFLFAGDFGSRAFELLNSKKVKFQKFQNSGLAHKSWKITSNSVAGHCLSPNHQSRDASDTFLIVQKFSRPVLVRFSTV